MAKDNAVNQETGEIEPDPVGWGTEEHAAAFMMGDLIKACKRRFTELAVPWSKLEQSEQERVLQNLHDDLCGAVKTAAKIIAANARITFRAEVESVQFKGPSDVKAQLKLVNTPETHALADTAGGFVTIVIEDLDELLSVPEDELAGEPDDRALFDKSTD
jgi:predicted Fe-S protein YdhL (DUF1289 family)